MAIRLSTGLRQALLGAIPARSAVAILSAKTTIAAVDGGAGADSFTDSDSAFLTAGFAVGDAILALGFTGGMAGIVGPFTATSVAAGVIEVASGLLTADAASEAVTLVAIRGGSFRDIFKNCVLEIYSGSQPATADTAESGTKLLRITAASGAFSAGSPANGLHFGAPSAGVIAKSSAVWSGVGLATGTAGWWRLYNNAYTTGGGTSGINMDGNCATSGGDLNMASLTVTLSATTTIDSFSITEPAS